MKKQYFANDLPVQVLLTAGAILARAECTQCGGHEEWRITKAPPPDQLKRHFTIRGWALDRKVTCPSCIATNKLKKQEDRKVIHMTQAANTEAAKRNKRNVIIALEDYFDDKSMCYKSGHSDESVARELNLASSFVIGVREEFYGKLSEPQEITELRNALTRLTTESKAISDRLDALSKKHGWAA